MRLASILIVEDDLTLNEQVAKLLTNSGYSVEQCFDGQQGLQMALEQHFDLVLLDVMLPSLNGFSFLKQFRRQQQTPVMVLTAKGAEQDRIDGFTIGADDYLAKPFNFTEMKLRVEVLLRRTLGAVQQQQSSQISRDQLRLDRIHQQVYYADKNIELTPIQFRILWELSEHPAKVLTKPYLYRSIFDRGYNRYDRSLDMHLSRVRKKLVEAGMPADRLATVHGKGYRFS